MSEKLNRLKKLDSAEVQKNFKHVKLEGLPELMEQMKDMAATAAASQNELIKAIQELGKVITNNKLPDDTKSIIAAVQELMIKVQPESQAPTDYRVDFERDGNGLMKSGIRFTSTQPKSKH